MTADRGQDEIAELIRRAGRRPTVPEERTAGIRADLHEHWRAGLGRRSRFHWGWVAALATAAVLVVALGVRVARRPTGVDPGISGARIDSLAGSARLMPGAESENAVGAALQAGDVVPIGSRLITEADGRVGLMLPSGYFVRLDRGSRVRFLGGAELELQRGAVYVDSGSQAVGGSLVVLTDVGTIRDIGTQFEVRVGEGSLRVRVREGRVVLDGDREAYDVAVGNELVLDDRGTATRRKIEIHGPEWNWIAEVTPPLDLEGRKLLDFLEWASRERGLRLAFDGESAMVAASTIVLSGSVEGLSPEQALESVLPTCRMTYGVDRGVLTIRQHLENE